MTPFCSSVLSSPRLVSITQVLAIVNVIARCIIFGSVSPIRPSPLRVLPTPTLAPSQTPPALASWGRVVQKCLRLCASPPHLPLPIFPLRIIIGARRGSRFALRTYVCTFSPVCVDIAYLILPYTLSFRLYLASLRSPNLAHTTGSCPDHSTSRGPPRSPRARNNRHVTTTASIDISLCLPLSLTHHALVRAIFLGPRSPINIPLLLHYITPRPNGSSPSEGSRASPESRTLPSLMLRLLAALVMSCFT
ncbi:hypothetical protein BC628DRAFT_971940 [Trametes gibbosa]|nr:hypothetical protein BC628DRAFT_971940 [Trametes gibbosa]